MLLIVLSSWILLNPLGLQLFKAKHPLSYPSGDKGNCQLPLLVCPAPSHLHPSFAADHLPEELSFVPAPFSSL